MAIKMKELYGVHGGQFGFVKMDTVSTTDQRVYWFNSPGHYTCEGFERIQGMWRKLHRVGNRKHKPSEYIQKVCQWGRGGGEGGLQTGMGVNLI